jgi:hypothetical protein
LSPSANEIYQKVDASIYQISVTRQAKETAPKGFDYANDSLARHTRRVDNLTVTNDFGYNVRSEVIGADILEATEHHEPVILGILAGAVLLTIM